MDGALKGIRLIEVSQVLAAPFCGYQFALLGAEVIKVELPDSPDCSRGRGPIGDLNDRGLGLTYQVQGGNKASLALDIRTDAGREALLTLVEDADVFIENFATGVLQGLGLGYPDLQARNPALVYCSMTGYGEKGPKASKGAYDNTIQAASGTIAQCGGVKPGVSFVDYSAGYSAAFAISSALLQRHRTGKGCHITASMLEVALSLMAPEAAAVQARPTVQKTKEAGIAAYETAKGTLMLGVFKPAQYRKLGRCLADLGHNLPILFEISDWEDVWAQSPAIRAALRAIFVTKSAEEWQVILDQARIPAERVVPLAEAVTSAQVAARGYFSASPGDPDVTLPLAGFRMSEGGPALTKAPPALGQDSREVLERSGLNDTEIDSLFSKGIAK